MDIKVSSGQSFGWNYTTHSGMADQAMESVDGLSRVEAHYTARCATLPDFQKSKLGWRNNAHFFFPNSKQKSYGFGANGKNNGLTRFLYYVEKAKTALTRDEQLRNCGYAMHYLQDADTPVHTQKGGILHKMFKVKLHTSFERHPIWGATAHLSELQRDYIPQKVEFKTLEQLFYNTACFSSQPHLQPKYYNKKNWINIQHECYNHGVDVCREFMKYMMKYIKK